MTDTTKSGPAAAKIGKAGTEPAGERRTPKPSIVPMTENVTMTAPTEGLELNGYVWVAAFDRGLAGFENRTDFDHEVGLDRVSEAVPRRLVMYGTDAWGKRRATKAHVLVPRRGEDTYDLFIVVNTIRNDPEKCPWARHSWWSSHDGVVRWIEHLPRPSETIQGNLAYYQTPAKRAAGIETPIKPGRYLKKYFGDVLTSEEIMKYAVEWQTHFAPREAKITQNAAEIERIYRGNHLNSCMHFAMGGHESPVHPARAYAGPDLGVAYIGDINEVEARVLVWPDKKVYLERSYSQYQERVVNRVYGDELRMKQALAAIGYKTGTTEDFLGARMRLIRDGRRIVAPHCDAHRRADVEGDYLVLRRNGDIELTGLNGYAEGEDETYECDRCNDRVDEDDLYVLGNGDRICSSCEEAHTFRCDATEDLYYHSDAVPSEDGYIYSQSAVVCGMVTKCDATGLYYENRRHGFYEMPNGETWVDDYFAEHGFICDFDAECHPVEDRVQLDNGRAVAAHHLAAPTASFTEWLGDAAPLLGRDGNPDQLDMTFAEAA